MHGDDQDEVQSKSNHVMVYCYRQSTQEVSSSSPPSSDARGVSAFSTTPSLPLRREFFRQVFHAVFFTPIHAQGGHSHGRRCRALVVVVFNRRSENLPIDSREWTAAARRTSRAGSY